MERPEAEGGPEPAYFYEVDVEDIVFAREVGGGGRGVVRLRDGVVGGYCRVDSVDAPEGAEEDDEWIDG